METFKIFLIGTSKKTVEETRKFIPSEESYIKLRVFTNINSLKRALKENPNLIICDLVKKDDELLIDTLFEFADLENVVFLDYSKSYSIATRLLKIGAKKYFTMPEEVTAFSEFLSESINRWLSKPEAEKLRKLTEEKYELESFIGEYESIKEVLRLVKKAIEHKELTILITGETGTGKTMLAKIIHQQTYKDVRPFIEVNCATIPPTLVESELFGHEKGAFTDARQLKIGLFEAASGGTIFLDEITELDLSMQAKVLQVIEQKTFRRVGGVKELRFEGRIIAATNKDLEQEVKNGKFRKDLYYRLMIMPIYLPPLRERGNDIFIIAEKFIDEFNERYRKNKLKVKGLSPEAKELFKKLKWEGNVRELYNAIERAVILTDNEYLTPDDFPFLKSHEFVPDKAEEDRISISFPFESASLQNFESELVRKVLEKVSWNKSKASQILGISRPRLDRLIKKYRIG